MAEPVRSTHHDISETERGLTVVLIGAVDRRMLPALALVPQLADSEARAVHISVDPVEAHRLATTWMDLNLDWLPLHIEEPQGETLAESVRAVIRREMEGRPRVTVLVPEIDLGRWWQPILHRGIGRDIAWHLHDLDRVTTAVLPVRVDTF
jgi:hypothetical protein